MIDVADDDEGAVGYGALPRAERDGLGVVDAVGQGALDTWYQGYLPALGRKFEHHPRFPERTNTEFVVPVSRRRLRMRVWERGSGETLACGTGACAAAVAAVVTGRSDRQVTLHLLGGDLEIHWAEADNHVAMTGPAEYVFRGTFTWNGAPPDADGAR